VPQVLTDLPPQVEQVLQRFLCCEFSTVGSDGTPLTWPTVPLRRSGPERIVLSTSIGFAVKAANIRREPRVSLLYSDPTGSGLDSPPAVLVHGTATVADDVQTWGDDLGAHWRRVTALQPISRLFSSTPPARWFMDWYYMRLLITVTPREVLWWSDGDTSRAPQRRSAGAPGVG
jgi:hypothetical protein